LLVVSFPLDEVLTGFALVKNSFNSIKRFIVDEVYRWWWRLTRSELSWILMVQLEL